MTTADGGRKRAPKSIRFRRKALFALLTLLLVFACGELAARAYWSLRGLPFFTCQRSIYLTFYPEIIPIEEASIQAGADTFDILLLGASVINQGVSYIHETLERELNEASGQEVRIFNASADGHTTLDSYYKYRHLGEKEFDLVVVYHGINDVRANNCPPSVYREDYSHYAWYRMINAFEKRRAYRLFVFPLTCRFLFITLQERLGLGEFISRDEPKSSKWLHHGAEIKSDGAFRRNLEGIVRLAEERGAGVLLMTFSFYVPEDYTHTKFKLRTLDYAAHWFPIKMWGTPENVVEGIKRHNEVVRDLASGPGSPILVDQERLIPFEGIYFYDICHFGPEGEQKFVENLAARIAELIEARPRKSERGGSG
ncbi:hypothetical protein IIC65_07795 [Candidatus Sumerlaeota bacterium]|nr:hypothetical protein [Candidatus Sumerlaeota bacterium]